MSTIENGAQIIRAGESEFHDEADTSDLRQTRDERLEELIKLVRLTVMFLAGFITGYAISDLKHLFN